MGYIGAFLLGGFIGVLFTCCIVVGKDNTENEGDDLHNWYNIVYKSKLSI